MDLPQTLIIHPPSCGLLFSLTFQTPFHLGSKLAWSSPLKSISWPRRPWEGRAHCFYWFNLQSPRHFLWISILFVGAADGYFSVCGIWFHHLIFQTSFGNVFVEYSPADLIPVPGIIFHFMKTFEVSSFRNSLMNVNISNFWAEHQLIWVQFWDHQLAK